MKLYFFLSILAIYALTTVPGSSQSLSPMDVDTATIFVVPVDTSVVIEGPSPYTYPEVYARINVDAAMKDLTGYNMAVSYDTSFLQVLSVEEGWLPPSNPPSTFFWLNNWLPSSLPDTFVHVNGAILGSDVDGPGELFRIKFKCLRPGTTYADITTYVIRDSLNQNIPHKTSPAIICIYISIPAEQTTWGEIKAKFE